MSGQEDRSESHSKKIAEHRKLLTLKKMACINTTQRIQCGAAHFRKANQYNGDDSDINDADHSK